MPVLTFVRGEDLRTIVVPRGDAAAPAIVSLPTDRFTRPRRIDAIGDRDVTDVGRKNGRFLIGMQAVKQPFVLTVDHAEKPRHERDEGSDQRRDRARDHRRGDHPQSPGIQGIPGIDSAALHRAQHDEASLRNRRRVEAIEAAIAGDYFSEPHGRSDWVWKDFYINGVRWKYGSIPELPLIQPEKVSQLPLDIHLTNDYRYQLVRETEVDGYRVYEVSFQPPPNAPGSLPLYRGTVWIDKRTWARIRISMVQLNLTGEVLSNEERVDFQPFARATWLRSTRRTWRRRTRGPSCGCRSTSMRSRSSPPPVMAT